MLTLKFLYGTFVSYSIVLITQSADVCWDRFDVNLRNSCLRGEWQQRYYFDHDSLTCQLFLTDNSRLIALLSDDGCRSSSRNIFNDLLTCQWLCSEQTRYKTRACLEDFDEHYRDECNGGSWRQSFYFDKQKMRCTPFWYDGCTAASANLFPDLSSCMQTCESSVGELSSEVTRQKLSFGSELSGQTTSSPFAHQPSTHAHRHHLQRPKQQSTLTTTTTKRPMYRPGAVIYQGSGSKSQVAKSEDSQVTFQLKESENPCEHTNPCANNGTCVYDKLRKNYHCECVDGYRNQNCTELDDRDPCARQPCRNGATCTNKPNKEKLGITFDCFCPVGFGGTTCEEQPCEPNPCNNNGTCRVTKGNGELFFCDCPVEWGGRLCAVPIPNVNARKYGKNVQLLSSGKAEWIQDLIQHKQRDRDRTFDSKSLNSLEYNGNYTEPDDGLTHLGNGSDIHSKLHQSRTLRLPAGSTAEESSAPGSQPFQRLLIAICLFCFHIR
ncbi:Nidogen-2 [Aphelenchoides besseyi]|nr:Nidogen-2 [Aphelenchoides besseyi]